MTPRITPIPTQRKGLYGIPHAWWVLICLVYIVSPIDLVPEAILGPIGIADDAGLLAFGIYNLVHWLAQLRARRALASP